MASRESFSPPIPLADEHGQEDHRDHTNPVAAVDTKNTDAKLAEVERLLLDDDELEGINNVSEDQKELAEQEYEAILHGNEVEATAPLAAAEEQLPQPKQDSFNGNNASPAFPSFQEPVVARHSQEAMMTMHHQQRQQLGLDCLYDSDVSPHCSPVPKSPQDWSNQTQDVSPHCSPVPRSPQDWSNQTQEAHLPKFSSFQHPIQMQESTASPRSTQTQALQSQQVKAQEYATSSQAQALKSQLATLAAQESAACSKARQAQQVIAAGQESHAASYELQHQPEIAKQDPGLYYAIGDYVPPDSPPHPITK